MISPTSNLTNHFLIAMPALTDPNFSRTVTLIAEHNDQGALGVIINKPLDMDMAALFDRIDLPINDPELAGLPVYFGGPVQTDRGFVLHRPAGEWHSSLNIADQMALTSSKDILQSVGEHGVPHDVLVSLGYAGWSPGQLEQELGQNAWLTVPADVSIVFDIPPEERFAAAMQLLGIDYASLSEVAGHA
ncbi:MAG: YqgE/AlgH family protein [Rhodocyclaceae bacterium]|nr:YqgE/AlgH family protein [Rhodocyclaceae bacterium]